MKRKTDECVYKILHKPTGLYYSTKKGRWKEEITNLAAKGNYYTSLKIANKILNSYCKNAAINEAQTKRYNLKLNIDRWAFNMASPEDFELEKFILTRFK